METKQWFEFTFAFLGALGSLATVGAFIYLFRRDKDKQAQINSLADMVGKLTGISEALQMQLQQDKEGTRLQLLPVLKIEKHSVSPDVGSGASIEVTIKNYGKSARILRITSIDESFLPLSNHPRTPVDLNPDESKVFVFCLAMKRQLEGSPLHVNVVYRSELNYYYKIIIKGNFREVDVLPGEQLTPQEISAYQL